VIEKNLKLVCQESAMVAIEDFPRLILGAVSKILAMTFPLLGKDGTPRNTQPASWEDQICKYGSTNMQCQLLVIILMTMKAVKILIQFNRYCLSFLCQKQQSTTYHFLSFSKVF